MTDHHQLQQAADQLWLAQQNRQACSPIRHLFDDQLDVDTAYQIQQRNIDRAINEQGRRVVGRKIGLTSKVVQKQLGSINLITAVSLRIRWLHMDNPYRWGRCCKPKWKLKLLWY